MIYTTYERIRLRLGTRLNVVESSTLPLLGGQTKAGSISIDPERVELIASDIESRINAILGQIYEIPLPSPCHSIIGSIVDKMICGELMNIHYESNQMAAIGGDAGYGSVMLQQANNELKQLILGHGIFIPGVMSSEEAGYMREAQPISLTLYGAILKIDRPDTLTKNRTTISKLNNRLNNKDPFGFLN